MPTSTGNCDPAEAAKDREGRLGLGEGFRGIVGERRDVTAGTGERLDDRGGTGDRATDHLVVVLKIGADQRLQFGVLGDEKVLGLAPGAAAILLGVPFEGADLGQEAATFFVVGNEAPIRDLGVPIEEDVAEIEDDVADFGHAALSFFARLRVAPGTAASTTLRMTLGSASPGSASGGDHQHPDGAFSIAGQPRAIHVQFQPEMREDMHDRTGNTPPVGLNRRVSRRRYLLLSTRPFASRHFGHAAEKAVVRTLAEEDGAVGADGDESVAVAGRPLGLLGLHRVALLLAAGMGNAGVIQRAEGAGGSLRGADAGAEIHHRLGIVAGAVGRSQAGLEPRG